MRLVKQPKGSHLCGQACVAMLLNISLAEAIVKVSKAGRTTARDLLWALAPKLKSPALRLTKVYGLPHQWKLPDLAILRVRWNKTQSHWIVKKGNMIFDPGYISPVSFQMYIEQINGKITSYLELK